MQTFRERLVATVIAIALVLSIAWFYKGGEHFKNVALVCYGFVIGWLSAALAFKSKPKQP
jgi:uncharacterized membrane protein YfcA